jgi:hypothetical protein
MEVSKFSERDQKPGLVMRLDIGIPLEMGLEPASPDSATGIIGGMKRG